MMKSEKKKLSQEEARRTPYTNIWTYTMENDTVLNKLLPYYKLISISLGNICHDSWLKKGTNLNPNFDSYGIKLSMQLSTCFSSLIEEFSDKT